MGVRLAIRSRRFRPELWCGSRNACTDSLQVSLEFACEAKLIVSPEVSVILPVFNPPPELEAAVMSVLGQEAVSLELLIIDDGSTVEWPKPWNDDSRVRVFRKKNGGVASARNVGLSEARGSFVAFLDQDDSWTAGSLRRRVDLLKSRSACQAGILSAPVGPTPTGDAAPWFAIEGLDPGQSKVLARWEYCALQQKHGYFMLQGSLLDTSIVRSIGGFDESLFGCDDQDLLFRVLHDYDLLFVQWGTFVRLRGDTTERPENRGRLVWSTYAMLRKHIPAITRFWNASDAQAFWRFHDMGVRQCIREKVTNDGPVELATLRHQFSSLRTLRNMRAWCYSLLARPRRRQRELPAVHALRV